MIVNSVTISETIFTIGHAQLIQHVLGTSIYATMTTILLFIRGAQIGIAIPITIVSMRSASTTARRP
ncbi:MAG: hypothetical protein BGO89_13050 [Candidatus Kapaibacterium thiocyanatum]|uniref:Uncharacterized protein n=1 Tax=Candidatus Kapaibacterium thiocyanatum TaxID=1895771 RepID=A0A1M3KV52_9BACT|nr:MAG: hypothetical protein BGO89_13050 ['Candidatus Kapabacteria' thiocyanatum]